jgi:hypothetical protein
VMREEEGGRRKEGVVYTLIVNEMISLAVV